VAYHQSSQLAAIRCSSIALPSIALPSIALLASLLLSGCAERPETDTGRQDPVQLEIAITSWQQGKAEPMVRAMEQLSEATGLFLRSPTIESRLVWQSAWIKAHDNFLGASILYSPDNFRRIDAWPMETGFLDSLPDYPGSGIVSDDTLEISSTSLEEQHQITDESEVALGFHVLEYYAFERDIKDFGSDAPNDQKRQRLVQLVAELLQVDITSFSRSLETEPEANQDSYSLLLLKIQRRLQLVFSEFSLLGEHSPHSAWSSQNVSAQLGAIAELLDEPVGLNHFLIELNPESAQTFNETLLEAQTLLPAMGQPGEATSSRLMLLIASLSQQLGDFVTMLPGEGEI
jgi:hypothetical protein